MYEIPQDPKKLRARIKRYERSLRKEQLEKGFINDGYGKRYLVGPYYLVLGSLDEALDSFKWFKENFPDDAGEPYHRLCWALALYLSGDREAASNMLGRAMLSNLYMIPYVLGEDQPEYDMWHGSNDEDKEYLIYFPYEYVALWDSEAREWMRNQYYSPGLVRARERYVEIFKQLKNEPVGETRTKLVHEASLLSYNFK